MADQMVAIPVGIDETEEFGQRAPVAPAGWNELTVVEVEFREAQGKKIHEVKFSTDAGEEARRSFFLNAEALGFYIGFLRMIAPEVPKFAGLDPRPVLKGRRIAGLVKRTTSPYTSKKTGKTIQIDNADVEMFRAAGQVGPRPTNGSAMPSTGTPPPPPPSDENTPF